MRELLPAGEPIRAEHGQWLVLAMPAGATRARAAEPALADSLRAAGYVDADTPDVELAPARSVTGSTPSAIVPLGSGARPRRLRRLGHSLALRREVAIAERLLRAKGYGRRSTIAVQDGFRLVRGDKQKQPVPTLLEGAVAAAEAATGTDLAEAELLLRDGLVLLLGRDAVLRVGLAAPGRAIERQAEVHEQLRALRPSAALADLVPWVTASGRAGLASWSIEARLRGEPAAPSEEVLQRSIDVLVALHRLDRTDGDAAAGTQLHGEVVAAVASPQTRERLGSLTASVAERLQRVPTVFGHGDFFAGNLLARDGELVGLIDWERGGPGHPILQDLLHMQIATAQARTRSRYGRALVEVVLPRLRTNGGDALIERYCRELGIRFEPSLLMPLVTACWLFHVAHELARFRDRAENETWLAENVESVAAALAL
jgi:aminoglycoside phosphotransferase (APT) family kinase protein